ncbi:MAG: YkgJ family cysteine cluster protein [Candidatus Aureabacteria bacterium]|nr:YkgJ family cysteine cluster protein [Candidatus Auribacterota bacterium]
MAKTPFICVKCGECCRWHGYVHLTADDIKRMADFLKISEKTFIESFTRLTENRQGLSLREKPSGECVFLEESVCGIYSARPGQCRDFPQKWTAKGAENACLGLILMKKLDEKR